VLGQVGLRELRAVEQVNPAGAPAGGIFCPELPAQTGLTGDVVGEFAAGLGERVAPGAVEIEFDVKQSEGHGGLQESEGHSVGRPPGFDNHLHASFTIHRRCEVMDQLTSMRAFVKVVDAAGFAPAARPSNCPRPWSASM
jgi:hypothetical protein